MQSIFFLLVPKLCLGTAIFETLFRLSSETEFRGIAFPNRVWERESERVWEPESEACPGHLQLATNHSFQLADHFFDGGEQAAGAD